VVSGKRGDLEGDPDAASNLVKLTYREHLLAHRILARLAEPKFISAANGAVMFMLSTVEKQDRANSKKYAAARRIAIENLKRNDVTPEVILREVASALRSGFGQLVDGSYITVSEISRICEAKLFFSTAPKRIECFHRFAEELSSLLQREVKFDPFYRSSSQKEHARSIMQNKIWVTSLEGGKYLSIPQEEFDATKHIKGRVNLKTTKGLIHMNDGSVQKAVAPVDVQRLLDEGWKLGGLPKTAATKGYMKVTIDGVKDFVPYGVALSLWKEGRASSSTGNFIGKLGEDYQLFSTLLELRAAGYTHISFGPRAERVVIHRHDKCIMVPEKSLSSFIEQGWNIGRPGATKKSRIKKLQRRGIL
jgi:hypothetical protein